MIRGADEARKVLFIGRSTGGVNHRFTVQRPIKLNITSKFFLLTALFSVLAISTFAASFVVNAQVSPVEHALETGERAYIELKAADEAGANIRALAVQFNVALGLLENASRFEKTGDNATASALASEAENSFLAIIPAADSLQAAALSKQQQEATGRYIGILIGALIVAVVAVVLLEVNRRIRWRQFAELRIKPKVEM
jgi:4-amino-4-deoxy-L-arabinose transferase-like glycosyltransferase